MNKKMTKAAKVRRMLEKGVAVKEIAARLKTSKQYVYDIKSAMNRNGMGVPPVKMEGAAVLFDPLAPTSTPNDVQVGGAHYKALEPQPWDVIHSWGLGFLDGNVVKYVARYRSKGGIEDLQKARHYLDKLIDTVGG